MWVIVITSYTMVILALQGFCYRYQILSVGVKVVFRMVLELLSELCWLVTITMFRLMYSSSLEERETNSFILVDGPLPSALWLFSPVFRSFTIKAVQKLIVCIIPVRVPWHYFTHWLMLVAIWPPPSHYSLQDQLLVRLWVQCTNSKPMNICCRPLR